MAPPATAIVGPQPKEKKKKKLRRRGVKREQVLDVGGLMCVLLGMALCWAYMSYHFPDSAPRLLPKDGWEGLAKRWSNGLGARWHKHKAAERKRQRGVSDGPQQVWEELGPKPLQKREWLDSTRPSQLASARRPAAFSSNTPAEGWGARKKWSAGFLAAHEELQQLDGVYHHPSGKLLHHNPDAPLAADGDLEWEPPHRTLNCTSRCFFGALRSGRGGAAQHQPDCGECSRGPLSFTAELGPRFGSLWEDISGFEAFGVGSASPTAHMWIGAAGTTTLAHYDSYHNFFVQLQGSKRFFLMPPSAAEALYTFPRLHPSYRQAQLDLTLSMDSSRDRALLEPFPRMKRLLQAAANTPVGALVVDLEPGDVLYIPPYWFHLAGSLPPLQDQTAKAATALSVGVNVWSDAEELRAVEAFESVALPFEETWGPVERRTAVAVYARELLLALHGDGAQASLELMVETRWQPLMSSFAAAAPPEDCSSNGEGSGAGEGVCAVDARGEATDAAATEPAFGCSASELPLDEAGQAHFNERVGEAAAALLPAADHDASHGRRTLSLLAWNRLEQLAMWAVGGGADGVQLFISKIPETCSK